MIENIETTNEVKIQEQHQVIIINKNNLSKTILKRKWYWNNCDRSTFRLHGGCEKDCAHQPQTINNCEHMLDKYLLQEAQRKNLKSHAHMLVKMLILSYLVEFPQILLLSLVDDRQNSGDRFADNAAAKGEKKVLIFWVTVLISFILPADTLTMSVKPLRPFIVIWHKNTCFLGSHAHPHRLCTSLPQDCLTCFLKKAGVNTLRDQRVAVKNNNSATITS